MNSTMRTYKFTTVPVNESYLNNYYKSEIISYMSTNNTRRYKSRMISVNRLYERNVWLNSYSKACGWEYYA
jgi:hypothetical protein